MEAFINKIKYKPLVLVLSAIALLVVEALIQQAAKKHANYPSTTVSVMSVITSLVAIVALITGLVIFIKRLVKR